MGNPQNVVFYKNKEKMAPWKITFKRFLHYHVYVYNCDALHTCKVVLKILFFYRAVPDASSRNYRTNQVDRKTSGTDEADCKVEQEDGEEDEVDLNTTEDIETIENFLRSEVGITEKTEVGLIVHISTLQPPIVLLFQLNVLIFVNMLWNVNNN